MNYVKKCCKQQLFIVKLTNVNQFKLTVKLHTQKTKYHGK